MADELDAQKTFLTWDESAEILLTDASQSIARAQRLLAMRYQRGRGVPKDEGRRLLLDATRRTTKLFHGTAQPGRALRKRFWYCAGYYPGVSLVRSRSASRRFHRQRTFATLGTATAALCRFVWNATISFRYGVCERMSRQMLEPCGDSVEREYSSRHFENGILTMT